MGYYSSLSGSVSMSQKAYEKFIQEKLKGADNLPVTDYLEILEYSPSAQSLWLEGSGKMYHDEELVALLAKHKDLLGIDEIDYSGEESSDMGRYYIDMGKWCYVEAEIPPVPSSDDRRWKEV